MEKTKYKISFIIISLLFLILLNPIIINAETKNTTIKDLTSGRIITDTIKNNLGNNIEQKNYYVEVLNDSSKQTEYKKIDFRKTEEELSNRLLQREKKRVEELETLKNLNVSQDARGRGHDNLLLNHPVLYDNLKEDSTSKNRFLRIWFNQLSQQNKGIKNIDDTKINEQIRK